MREPYILFCTDGAPLNAYFWACHGSREAYSLLRQKEARLALKHVGATKVEFLKTRSGEHIVDQQLFQRLPEAIEAAFQVVSRVKPQALLTLAYEGGHPDHDSCNFITSVTAREHSLAAWEMPVNHLFHKGERKLQAFMPAPKPIIALHPTKDEIARKREALETYASQGHFLARLASIDESFRPLAEYDYTRPPHEGVLNYEAWEWSMTGKQVSAAFEACLNSCSELKNAFTPGAEYTLHIPLPKGFLMVAMARITWISAGMWKASLCFLFMWDLVHHLLAGPVVRSLGAIRRAMRISQNETKACLALVSALRAQKLLKFPSTAETSLPAHAVCFSRA